MRSRLLFFCLAVLLVAQGTFAKMVFSEYTENDFRVVWYDCKFDLGVQSCFVDVQNLNSLTARNFYLSFILSNTSYDRASFVSSATIKEWKALPTNVSTFSQRNVSVPKTCYIADNITNTSIPYDCSYSYVETYQNGSILQNINGWKTTKANMNKFLLSDKADYSRINIPKYQSKEKFDDLGGIETSNGTKTFFVEWTTKIERLDGGFGSRGKFAVVDDYTGIEYHPWWNTTWSSRKPITINGSTSALTDFQVRIPLNWTSGMNSTFTDLRFTDNSTNGVSLPFWIENYTVGVNATVWVKTNLSVGSNKIYVYYNNSAVLSLSNASSTFTKSFGANDLQGEWQMDEGSGTTILDNSGNGKTGTFLGGTVWNTQDGGFIANNSANTFSFGSATKFTNVGDAISVGNITSMTNVKNWTVFLWFNATSVNQYANIFDSNYKPGVYPPYLRLELDHIGPPKLYWYVNDVIEGNYIELLNNTVPTNVWFFASIRKNGTLYTAFLNGTKTASKNIATNPFFDNLTFGTGLGDNPAARQFFGVIDGVQIFNRSLSDSEIRNYYFRRKYASPEPVVLSVGAAEGQDTTPPTINIQSPSNKTYNTATIDLNFTLSESASSCIYELNGFNYTILSCTNTTIAPHWKQKSMFDTFYCSLNWDASFPCINANDDDTLTSAQGAWYGGVASRFENYSQDGKLNSAYYEVYDRIPNFQRWINISFNASCLNKPNNLLETKILVNTQDGDNWEEFYCLDSTSNWHLMYRDWSSTSLVTKIHELGIWENISTVIEGSNTIKIWANDTSNNWNVSSTIYFTIDTTPPTINIQSPSNTTYSTTNITLNYTYNEALSSCKYELNGANTTIGGCVNTSFIAAEGANTVKVWANDTAGNLNVSQTISFTVDTTAPTVAIQLPTNVTYASVSVPLNFTVGDAIGVSQCKYELNGAANVSLPNCANTTLTATTGNNTVRVWANDTANNWGVSTVAFKVDTVFPVWTLGNFPKSDNSTVVNGSITWDAKVYDANLYRILLNVTYAANGSEVYSLYESDWNLTQYNFTGTTDTSGWAEGRYVAEFSATDDHTFGGLRGLNYSVDGYNLFFGNGKTNYSFVFQTKNPDGTIMPLAMSAGLSTNILYNSTRKEYKWGYALKLPNPNFRATVFLNSSTDRVVLRNASIAHFVIGDFYVDFSDVLKTGYLLNVSAGSGGFFIDIWKESYGVAPNSVIVIDPVSGGTNTQTESYSFNVDHNSPSITLNSPINTSWINNNTPVFNLTVVDNIASSGACNLTRSGVRVATGTWTNNTAFTLSNSTALVDGTYYWNATCVDSAGNSRTSQTFAVSIDTVNPNVVCVSCPVSSSTSSLTFSVTATDALSGVNTSRLYYRGAYYTMSKSGDTYSYSLTENNNGEYAYQFFVNDTAGNLNSTVTGTVVVGASSSSPPAGGGGGGGGNDVAILDLLGKLKNLTEKKPFVSENVSYIQRPEADKISLNLSAVVFDFRRLNEPFWIVPSTSIIQSYVAEFPKWSVLVPISATTGLLTTAAFGSTWGGFAWIIASYFEAMKISGLPTYAVVDGVRVALNATVGG